MRIFADPRAGMAAHEPWLLPYIPESGTLAFDVGANGGVWSAELADRFEKVVALEPAAESFAYLEEHFSGIALQVAVSDRDGEVELWEQPDPLMSGQLTSRFTVTDEDRPRIVPCRTLDSLAEEYGEPDFIKVDVEGHELEVLDGGAKTLAQYPTLIVEDHVESLDVEDRLRALGYRVSVVVHPAGPFPAYTQHLVAREPR